MVKVTMKLTGFDRLRGRIERQKKRDIEAFFDSVDRLTDLVLEFAIENSAVNRGRMREGIIKNVRRTANGYSSTVEAGNGLIYVEYGTGLKAALPSKNGRPKSPNDVPHTSKGTWFIPASKLSSEQYVDLRDKYRFRMFTNSSGEEFFICHGQAPQPFMYPAALYGMDSWNDNAAEWFYAAQKGSG